VRFDGDILFVYAKDEDAVAIEGRQLRSHISSVASKIVGREINIVIALPRQLVS
jgi:hypothetical protein